MLASVTYHAPPPAPSRRKPDPVQENREYLRQVEIRARLAAGEKPSRLVAWLNEVGFVGTGATLNGFLK